MGRKIEIVCTVNNVEYGPVRGAMCQGARTVEDLKAALGVCGECESCKENLDYILSTCCGCQDVTMKEVQDLVADGVKDLEKIMEITKAGTKEDCGRCQALIENIIAQGY